MPRTLIMLSILFLAQTVTAEESPLDTLLEQASRAETAEQFPQARAVYEEAARKYPDAARSWAALGEHLRFYAHDYPAASAAFEKSLASADPDPFARAYAYRGLGELAAKKGDGKEAERLMLLSVQAKPLSDTHRSLCHLYVMRGDWKNAAEQARLAAEIDPNDPIALLLYAAQLHRAGSPDEAAQRFKTAMQSAGVPAQGEPSAPVHCCVWYNAAGYHAVRGDLPKTLDMLTRFFNTPNHRHLTRAEILADPDFTAYHADPKFQTLLNTHLPDTKK